VQVADYVRTKAYHRFMERGGQHGDDFNDWVTAERSVPKRAWVGYRAARLDDGSLDHSVGEPGIVNWEELFCGSRRPLVPVDSVHHVFVSVAWIDERHGPHSNGEFPDETCWSHQSPYPFPDVHDLARRDVTINFHGPVLIRWEFFTPFGKLDAISFRFMRHPDTCCVEIPRIRRPEMFRRSSGQVGDFLKGQMWADSKYNTDPCF
jgi:hypothetical protein